MKFRLVPSLVVAVLVASLVAMTGATAQATPRDRSSQSTVVGAGSPAGADGTVGTQAAWDCPSQHICIFSERDGLGNMKAFFFCGFVDLGLIDYPGGGKWNDKTSSVYNNQTPNTTSILYNWNGVNNWIQVTTIGAGVKRNMSASTNDIVDGIKVC